MKKMFTVVLMIAAMALTPIAMAANSNLPPVGKTSITAYTDSGNRLVAVMEDQETIVTLPAEKAPDEVTVGSVKGVNNGLITQEASFDEVEAVVFGFSPNGAREFRYMYLSTLNFHKVEASAAYGMLDESIRTYVESWGTGWPQALMDLTIMTEDGKAGHLVEVFDEATHLVVAKYYFGKGQQDFLGVYLNVQTRELVLCKAPGKPGNPEAPGPKVTPKPPKPGEPTPTPTPTPANPTPTPTPGPTSGPTDPPKPTDKPTATPVVEAPTERPADNDDGGYGDNPIEKTTVAPVATPKVTAPPERVVDNGDGGYRGDNPLGSLSVTEVTEGNSSGGNSSSGSSSTGQQPATPQVEAGGENPL